MNRHKKKPNFFDTIVYLAPLIFIALVMVVGAAVK